MEVVERRMMASIVSSIAPRQPLRRGRDRPGHLGRFGWRRRRRRRRRSGQSNRRSRPRDRAEPGAGPQGPHSLREA